MNSGSSPSVVVDACTWLNMNNGALLTSILRLPRRFAIGPLTLAECGSAAVTLNELINQRQIELLDDSSLPAQVFGSLLSRYSLGDGETESLAFALTHGSMIATDDKAARGAAILELGRGRLTGTLGLVREAVHAGGLDLDTAWKGYKLMIQQGGFLPSVTKPWFLLKR